MVPQPAVPLAALWLAVLLAALAVFGVSSLVHMVLKWHNPDYRALPDEAEVAAALRKGAPAPGQYVLPWCMNHEDLGREEMVRRFTEGPVAFLWIRRPGLPAMGSTLALWFGYTLVVSLFVAYLVSRTVPGGAGFLPVFRVGGTAAFLAYAGGTVPASIWMGKPWGCTLKDLADALLFALATGAVLGWLWP
jgi:hypothetical protein